MAGKKTHEQQLRIIEERVNTKNADDDFDAEEDLKRSEQEKAARREGRDLKSGDADLVDPDDREMLRGVNQESRHQKRRAD
jgi:hypothetical protein